MCDSVIAALREFDSTIVSDALDSLGLQGVLKAIPPRTDISRVVVGRAKTVQLGPAEDDIPREHICADAVADSGPSDVILIANGGNTEVSAWGGLLTLAAVQRGVAGVVVDGACRDIPELVRLGLPIFASGVTPRSARGRLVEVSYGARVMIGNVPVDHGDLIVADSSGIVAVAEVHAAEVVARARTIIERERRMQRAIHSGRSVTEVMHDSEFSRGMS